MLMTTPEMRLEVILIPVTDINRAKKFYSEQVGFHVDFDDDREGMRLIQMTPPGSGCSIVIGKGWEDMSSMIPGSVKGLTLVVKKVSEVRDLLISRGVKVSDIVEYPREIRFAYFSDPDGNSWALQEFPPTL